MTSQLNFAPYSDPPPLPRWNQGSPSAPLASSSTGSYQDGAPVSALSAGQSFSSAGFSSSTGNVSGMETTLPYDLGWLAAAAYALGPFGAAVLLLTEFESDYLRFHAYQSALLSAAYLVVDFLSWMIVGSRALQWLLILGQVASLVLLSMRAYRDTDLLDRYYVPLLGRLAEGWVAEE